MKLNKVNVFEEDSVMFLSFSCENPQDAQRCAEHLYAMSIEELKNGWRNYHRKFDVRFDEDNNEILVREKNNPPGNYGHAIVLDAFPAQLLQEGLIDPEQMAQLDADIRASKAYMDREAARRMPDYMRPS